MVIDVGTTESVRIVLDQGLVEPAPRGLKAAQRRVAPRWKREVRRVWRAMMMGAAFWLVTAPAAEAQMVRRGTKSSADVEEARQLNQRVMSLYKAARYDAAIPLAQHALELRERALGRDHSAVSVSLSNLAALLVAKGEYDRAESLYQRALAIQERTLGRHHLTVGTSLSRLAALRVLRGEYGGTEALFQRALAIQERALGLHDAHVASTLNNFAKLCQARGEYRRAELLYKRALSIEEKTLGPDHPGVALSLIKLANLYQTMGEYDRVEPLHQRALAIQEKALGSDHPDVALSLTNIASLYKSRAGYGQAEAFLQRALAIEEKVLGPDHIHVAAFLNNLAVLYVTTGQYDRAEAFFQRALAIREKALGLDHVDVAHSLNDLANLYQVRGDYDRAELLYERALAIREKSLGLDHVDVAASLGGLALLYDIKGQYDRADPLYKRALAILEKVFGPDHLAVIEYRNHLAMLCWRKGEDGRAEAHFQRALAIEEKALGPDHLSVATSLYGLAEIYQNKGEYDRAEAHFQRALAIAERALGPDHPSVATFLASIARLYQEKGENDRAEKLYQRALAIAEKGLGPDHPAVATLLNNFAELYRMKGEYGLAESLYQRSLASTEKAFGDEHPSLAKPLTNLALLYWTAGRVSESILVLTRGQGVEEKTFNRVVAAGSEIEKRDYLATFTSRTHARITLALQTRDPQAARLALTAILGRKGRVLDAMAAGLASLRAHLGPEEQKLLDELGAARAQYVTLVLQGPGSTPRDAYRASLGRLDEQIRARESAINARSAAFRVEQQATTIAAIQAALPEGAALVEWVVYKPFNPKYRTRREEWDPARYAACVLTKHGDPVWIDLGDEATINADVQAVRAAFGRPANTEVTGLARALEARIMAPVRALLGDTRRVLLSPDGALNLIPFAALVGDDGHPLLERYSFTYLTSGRELLSFAVPTPRGGDPLILANPEFDAASARPGAGRFLPLRHADEEAVTVARLFPGSTVLLHRDATKQRLQEARGPRLLHIGTHGYFEPMVCMTDPKRTAEAQRAALSSSLLQSGIALAGANACASGRDEGLLTASEASSLDLYGTKLVVLSACQTGVGDATAGDGVYGLRRALVLAGAETQVMSLWPVDGEATADLMKSYYESLAKGGKRGEAMRGVQLAMLHDKRWSHPYYWASFIVSGDDRSLDEKAVTPDLRVHPGGACMCRAAGAAPEASMPWLGAAAALGLWFARRRPSPSRASRNLLTERPSPR